MISKNTLVKSWIPDDTNSMLDKVATWTYTKDQKITKGIEWHYLSRFEWSLNIYCKSPITLN